MAYDAEPGGDPRGPHCPKCNRPIMADERWTIVHSRGASARYHVACVGNDPVEQLQAVLRRFNVSGAVRELGLGSMANTLAPVDADALRSATPGGADPSSDTTPGSR